ncbi:MAG: hypothetical protein AB7F36_01695 [Reyranellaceae bacterium]
MKLLRINGAAIDYPYTEAQLRADHPNTSFPRDLSQVDLSDWGVFLVPPVVAPAGAGRIFYIEGAPERVDGAWRQTWERREMDLGKWREQAECTPVQFRLATLQLGWLDPMEALLAQHRELYIRLEYGLKVERRHPAWDQMAPLIGATPDDIDAVFALARTIE